ncbi:MULTISPECIES: CpaF/VirB11 family protein [Candidatus Ichthyocystis]|uniref:Putative type II/IV secretion system protein n=1 Tax=Candidatus Ichthyocystis hellenicum TaxID=1561003 RepID=A0A0S4M3I3_9BURK|nr:MULTISPECIES: CpaF/VirB11 family protein [Ichthyocystis]CUT17426.1 putative type II/IV secretion system protein [Candidatus Ichthyocystis hellenicum]
MIIEYLRPLKSLLEDPDIADIAVNNDQSIWFCKKNEWHYFDYTLPLRSIYAISSLLSAQRQQPIQHIDCFDFDDLRISIAHPPISWKREIMVIRKHRKECPSLDNFTYSGLDPKTSEKKLYADTKFHFFKKIILDRNNIVISGETGSGKTSLLRSLTNFFHPHERIVFVQDTAEIIDILPSAIFLMTNKKITLKQLIPFSLRCYPNRIIVGEIRGSEIYAFLESCNTGHRGNITTVHANSARDTLYRLETLLYQAEETNHWSLSMVKKMIYSNIDYIVHMKRGVPFPIINEIIHVEGTNDRFIATNLVLQNISTAP